MKNKPEKIRASVAMAVYEGEVYLKQQIDSILNMMVDNDELVISYNESKDNTFSIIQEYEKKDARVKVYIDKKKSVESNFNNAVKMCEGEYIFLADQDDVWIDDKINKMVNYMKCNEDVVLLISDGLYVDENLYVINESMFNRNHTTTNPIRNYIRGTYLGCQMAFKKELKCKVWPVKETHLMAHDLWLGVMASFYGQVHLMNDKLILHRIHADNCSNTRKLSLLNVIKSRMVFMWEIISRLYLNCKKKR